MQIARYKRYSINPDDQSRDQCGLLADNLTVSMSGLIRMLIRNAFEDFKLIVQNRTTVNPA